MAILLISPEPWDAHAVSKHHYARTLASQGHRVFFLDPPERGRRQITLEPLADNHGVVRVRAPRVAPGLRRMPRAVRCWLECRWLLRLEAEVGCRMDVIWLFENSRFFDLRFAGSRLKIYHQVDLNQGFHPDIAARTADVCFCASSVIRRVLLPHNERTYFIQHGTAAASAMPFAERQYDWLSDGCVNAAYVGNLAIPYLDWPVLIEVVRGHPHVQFHMIGGFDAHGQPFLDLANQSNVVWWGKVESDEIPGILEQMDILLLCYSQDYCDQVSNPHKLMEYLASGRIVVATYTEEFNDHSELIVMSQRGSNVGYSALFSSVLSQLSVYNSPERMAARRAFAAEHAYPRQLQRIQGYLRAHGLGLPLLDDRSGA